MTFANTRNGARQARCSAAAAALVIVFLAVPSSATAQEGEVGIPLGSKPDPVVLESLTGAEVDLSTVVGHKPVLLEFWATWCEQCKALEPTMIAAHQRFGDRVDFIAIAVGVNQSTRSIQRYLENHPLPFEFLYDGRGRATRAYKAPTTSYIVMLDSEGRVAYTGVGVDQNLESALERLVGS
jgi:thiol-disulfide isomerase/thioredoxin